MQMCSGHCQHWQRQRPVVFAMQTLYLALTHQKVSGQVSLLRERRAYKRLDIEA